jgi:hypothetical protein
VNAAALVAGNWKMPGFSVEAVRRAVSVRCGRARGAGSDLPADHLALGGGRRGRWIGQPGRLGIADEGAEEAGAHGRLRH